MRRSFELLVFFFLHQDLGHLIILEEVGRGIKMGEIGVYGAGAETWRRRSQVIRGFGC
jgi:hypothetical protein